MKHIFIVNPAAGKCDRSVQIKSLAETVFGSRGLNYEVLVSKGPGDCTRLAREAAETGEEIRLYACGGDGTLNEVVTGAMRAHFEGSVAFLPCGTTNDLAASLKLPKNLLKGAKMIAETEGKNLDFGSFNRSRYFTYVAAFGAFTDVSYTTDQKLKNVFGHAAYVSEGIMRLQELRSWHVKVTCDDEVYEDDFLFGAAANALSLGGVMKLKKDRVDMADGYHEVLLIRNPKNAVELAQLSRELLSGNFENKEVLFFKGKKITFECEEEIPWCLDGEYAGRFNKAVVRNLNDRLKIVYP